MIFLQEGNYSPEQLADMLAEHMAAVSSPKCLCCGESMSLLSRTLNRQMVGALLKIWAVIDQTGLNDVVPPEFTGVNKLTRTQYANLNVLQKHGMIYRINLKDGHRRHYGMSPKAGAFLRGEIATPKTVYSFRNKLMRKSPELVTVSDIMGEAYTDVRDTLFFNAPTNDEIDKVRVLHKVKRKKRKNPCPNCPTGELKERFVPTGETAPNVMGGYKEIKCDGCDYRVSV